MAYIYNRHTTKTVCFLFLFALTGIAWILSVFFIILVCMYFCVWRKIPKQKQEKEENAVVVMAVCFGLARFSVALISTSMSSYCIPIGWLADEDRSSSHTGG